MTRTRSQLNIPQIAKDCYGDDLSILFGSSSSSNKDDDNNNNNSDKAVIALFESMLDRVHEEVQQGMTESLEKHKVQELLCSVERCIHQFEQEAAAQKQADDHDKASARQAVLQVSLPEEVTPADLVNLKAYEKMKLERDALEQEIANIEQETAELEAKRMEQSAIVDRSLQNVQKLGKELDQSADLCSMVSS